LPFASSHCTRSSTSKNPSGWPCEIGGAKVLAPRPLVFHRSSRRVGFHGSHRKLHSLPRPVKYQGGGVRTSVWPISRGESISFSTIPNFSPSFRRCPKANPRPVK
jgi:hypothetical protein